MQLPELQNNNKTWEELNLELAIGHSDSLKNKKVDLKYLYEEAKSSLKKFNDAERREEEPFDSYLENFIKNI